MLLKTAKKSIIMNMFFEKPFTIAIFIFLIHLHAYKDTFHTFY